MNQVLYVVQLFPEDAPHLLKLGCTTRGMDKRLDAMRTYCPLAQVIKTWASPGAYESVAIAYMTRDCERLGGEVYRCFDLPALLARGEEFFSLDASVIADWVAKTPVYGRTSSRRSSAEIARIVTLWRLNAYTPRSRQELHWLKKRAKQFDSVNRKDH